MPEPHRVLVIANRTCPCPALLHEVARRSDEHDAVAVLLVAPALNSRLRHYVSDVDSALAEARERLELATTGLAELGLDASSEVGDADPHVAICDALARFPATEIIVSTLPPGQSNWLERGLIERAQQDFDVPVPISSRNTAPTPPSPPAPEASSSSADSGGRLAGAVDTDRPVADRLEGGLQRATRVGEPVHGGRARHAGVLDHAGVDELAQALAEHAVADAGDGLVEIAEARRAHREQIEDQRVPAFAEQSERRGEMRAGLEGGVVGGDPSILIDGIAHLSTRALG